MRGISVFARHAPSPGRAWYGLGLACALLLGGCSTPPAPTPVRPAASYLTDEQAHDIAIHALGLVGTPYRYGGNTPESGFDCSGLIGYVYRHRVGTAPPRTVHAPSSGGDVRMDHLQSRHWSRQNPAFRRP